MYHGTSSYDPLLRRQITNREMSNEEAVNQRKAKQCRAANEVAGEGRAGPPPSCHSLPLEGNGGGLHGDGRLSLLQIKQREDRAAAP